MSDPAGLAAPVMIRELGYIVGLILVCLAMLIFTGIALGLGIGLGIWIAA